LLTEKDLFNMECQTVRVMTFDTEDQLCEVKIYNIEGTKQIHCENSEYDFYFYNGTQPEGVFFVYEHNDEGGLSYKSSI
jgi:hypothetical protein